MEYTREYIITINLLVLAIVFVGGLCQDLEQDPDSKSYDDATSEAVKVLKCNNWKCSLVMLNIKMQLQKYANYIIRLYIIIIYGIHVMWCALQMSLMIQECYFDSNFGNCQILICEQVLSQLLVAVPVQTHGHAYHNCNCAMHDCSSCTPDLMLVHRKSSQDYIVPTEAFHQDF